MSKNLSKQGDKNMFKNKLYQVHILGLGLTAALMSATVAPASAEIKIIGGADFYKGSQPSSVGNIIYGSPISAPMPVNPVTGLTPNRTYYSSPSHSYHSYPNHIYYSSPSHSHHLYPDYKYHLHRHGRYKNQDTILVNPVLTNPSIINSTLINPTIVDSSDRKPGRQHIIIKSPW
ncbi:hypothetical protein QUB80_31875 [Chlorogloeopsis sp. ULAP01]|uniref:hypothetical protein n=1 Tax=Chlorogloeopsis sp. ULAP01 TaxID=3056483 RepID=UPI0025AB4062|nr:hypothetical protein [Chlorogloeopsis sp. ULAP01]MDM9385255.1 hypothetical protein [Chlorogloeopsis sp. ULAP01]